MHAVPDLGDIPFAPTRAVIINCGTKWVTSLALASTLAHTDFPVLVIDCESKDGSRKHFEWLARRYDFHFHWLEWPLRPHPAALDALFRDIQSDVVLLIDSDVEIRTRRVFEALHSALASSNESYGAGFLHGPGWIGAEHGLLPYTGYYAPRMWIPLVLLRTEVIRHALKAGQSFANRRLFLGNSRSTTLSRLAEYKHRIRGLRRLRLPMPSWNHQDANIEFDGRRPAFIEYDTGSDMHSALESRGYRFIALPEELWGDVHHYHGVTRAGLTNIWRRTARLFRLSSSAETPEPSILSDIKSRLANVYGIQDQSRDD